MNWRAIGIAIAVGIAGSLALGMLFHLFPFDAEKHPMWAILAISYVSAALVDIAVGATAGWLAARRGALHGLLAGLISGLISTLMGFAMMWVRTRGAVPIEFLPYVFALLWGLLLGVVLATLSGAVAAWLAARQVHAE
jgi:hypothetical protein